MILSRSDDETQRVGETLARCLPDGTTVALIGPLGAGKTALVRGLAAACGVPPELVVSPTFVLYQPYRGSRDIHHFDVYRLTDSDQFLQLGPEECFESPGITIIEWADRVAECLPADHVRVEITVVDPTTRQIEMRSHGPRYENVVRTMTWQLAGVSGQDQAGRPHESGSP